MATVLSNQQTFSAAGELKTTTDLAQQLQEMLKQLQDQFQRTSEKITNRMDDAGRGLDEIEQSITQMMTEAGVEQ
jgi:heat shock factor-binding protein 1